MTIWQRYTIIFALLVPCVVHADDQSTIDDQAHGTVTAVDTTPDPVPSERHVWHGTPITVPMNVGVERIVQIQGAPILRAGLLGGPVPGLHVQALGDKLYLRAEEPFEHTRLIVQDTKRPSIILDLTAPEKPVKGATNGLILVQHDPNYSKQLHSHSEDASTAVAAVDEKDSPVDYTELVRHASQSLYAPTRLIPRSTRIVRTPLRSRLPFNLVRGSVVEATPVATWRGHGPYGPLWVTAVRLQNRLARTVTLDPRDLRGQWRAAAFQHAKLTKAGTVTDTTTVYLISDRRFEQAMGAFAPVDNDIAATKQEEAHP